jgi:hypothetical protein
MTKNKTDPIMKKTKMMIRMMAHHGNPSDFGLGSGFGLGLGVGSGFGFGLGSSI